MEHLTTVQYLVEIDKNPDSVYVLHERSERRFPVHQHSKGQLTYVEGGIAYVHIDGKSYVIPARHFVWIPKGVNHFLQVRHQATAIRTLYFYTAGDDSDSFYNKLGIYPISNLLHEMIIYTGQWHGHIDAQNQHFTFLQALKKLLPQPGTHHLPIVLPTTQNERLRPVLQYLITHISHALTLHSVSKHFGISERTLSRLFQQMLSISFLQYLKQLRMVKAVELMLQTDLTLSQIAFATGYASLSAFSNTFYQLTHIRPSSFSSSIRH